jgi:very-short-patch-repair endonuclease
VTQVTDVLIAPEGVAQRRELIARGIPGRQLSIAVNQGHAFRPRKGWYALPGTSRELIRAVRVGGRLGCVSAARHFGWAVAERPGLHVCVATNAARLRAPHDKRERMSAPTPEYVTLHWVDGAGSVPECRLVTSRRETVLQLALCQSAELAVAAYDSFLHLDPVGSLDLDLWLQDLPDAVLANLMECNRLCHSFLESIGRIRLAQAGIRGTHQVRIRGVGRVDLVLDGWLVIEWDGLEHHDNSAAHDEDCRRDAVLATLNYRCLRFTYDLVLNHWPLVLAAIQTTLAGKRP